MLKFIIRLDDACPNMNEEKWKKIELLLDKYNIKPIVGIIPDNKDKEFKYPIIENFWKEYPLNWQKKGWIIAQHGLNHNLSDVVRTEYIGKSLDEQINILDKGYKILQEKGIIPICFFAPNHTFDDNTIEACNRLGYFKFISDGYAFFPYKYKNMLFLPSVFDTPHKVANTGVFTFVYHPNKITDDDLDYLENFIIKYKNNFDVDIHDILNSFSNRKKTIKDCFLEFLIKVFRIFRKIIKGE